jgi:cytochrome P450
VDHGDLFSALTAAECPGTGDGFTDEQISDQATTFFLSGSETTANTVAWTLYVLAHRPELQERLYSEADAVLAAETAQYHHLPDLKLTANVVTETLRMHSPVWMATRTATADTKLGDYFIPSGTSVAYSPYIIHHRADLYEDPDAFDPDRWDPDRPQPPRDAFIPFAGGPRKCIADKFATTQASSQPRGADRDVVRPNDELPQPRQLPTAFNRHPDQFLCAAIRMGRSDATSSAAAPGARSRRRGETAAPLVRPLCGRRSPAKGPRR